MGLGGARSFDMEGAMVGILHKQASQFGNTAPVFRNEEVVHRVRYALLTFETSGWVRRYSSVDEEEGGK